MRRFVIGGLAGAALALGMVTVAAAGFDDGGTGAAPVDPCRCGPIIRTIAKTNTSPTDPYRCHDLDAP